MLHSPHVDLPAASPYNGPKVRKNIFLIVILGACLPVLCRASIFQITVDAPINAVTAEYILQAVDRADAEKAELLIIALNTPGGLDTSMRQIIEKILGARTPCVAWVSPSGARAASAGLFIALACDLFIMAPGTNTGAAHPVGVAVPGQSMDQTMADKITEDAAAYIKSLAERRGRNVAMAENAVRKSLSYTAGEALEGGLIDGLAGTTGDLIGLING